MNRMTKEEFKQYLRDEYNIAPEARRLICNILPMEFEEILKLLAKNDFEKGGESNG